VRCSALQRAAQCVAVCCSALQCVATRCTVRCSVLQCVAVVRTEAQGVIHRDCAINLRVRERNGALSLFRRENK